MWPAEGGGETSASPAAQHGIDRTGVSPAQVLANLWETLELPGTVSDYHFAIQGAADWLWPRRRDEPSLMETTADLSRLDIQIIAAHPETIRDEFAKEKSYYTATAFSKLTDMYLREGQLREALDIARAGARFDQAVDVQQIEAWVAALEGEPRR